MSLQLSQKAPNFVDLKGVDNKAHSLTDYTDQILVILFSCNHCPYVMAYEERYKQIQSDYADKGVKVIAINSNDAVKYPDDSFDNMIHRAKERNYNIDYLYDESQDIARVYGASNTPHAFLLDKERNLRYVGRIDDNWEDANAVQNHDLRNAIEDLLNGKELLVNSTLPVGCSIKWK